MVEVRTGNRKFIWSGLNIGDGFIEAKSDIEKKSFHSKVEQYLARAEQLKKIVKSTEQGTHGVEC